MQNKSFLKFAVQSCLSAFGTFLFFIGVTALILYLYDVSLEPVLYAGVLCFTVLLLRQGIKLYKAKQAHQTLQGVLKNLPVCSAAFPEPQSIVQQDLQELVQTMQGFLQTAATERTTKEQETMDFYATWVHQIKTPIAVMKMYLQKEDTKENRLLLAELFSIENYVEMALSYLRLDSASTDFVFARCALDKIIKEAIRKYAPQFVEKKLSVSYTPTDLVVLTDEKWLSFAVEQLLSNAVKYTPRGTVTIAVQPDGILEIRDTGIGIAPEDLPRVFDKGYTGYNGRADKKATGLGLYLCKRVCENLSHSISLTSEVGKGTSVCIDLSEKTLGVE